MNKIASVKQFLSERNADAWIIYDYECTNDALVSFVGKRLLTRKLFMVIPKAGKPFIICHTIDVARLKSPEILKDFEIKTYQTWKEFLALVTKEFGAFKRVLMEISEDGSLPRSSYCDYGTVELVKSCGVEVVSSADLLISFISTYDGEALESQKRAMKVVAHIKDDAFKLIEKALKEGKPIREYEVVEFIVKEFERNHLVFDSYPIVAVNGNAGNPHYEPTKEKSSFIKKGDLILIDLWAKEAKDEGVYADITWMAYAGKNPPKIYVDLFNYLKESIDAGLAFLNKELPKRDVCGYEVDQCVRDVLAKYKLDQYLVHRVGHSISIDDSPHGKGVNIDNYETHDTRHILNHVGFSIEPGIYTKEYGLREEIDVYIDNKQAISVAPRQEKLILLDIE